MAQTHGNQNKVQKMLYVISRSYPNQEIRLPVQTRKPERLVIRVTHPKLPNTVYFFAEPIINGTDMITVKIPRMPEQVVMQVYNAKTGPVRGDNTFRCAKPGIFPIVQTFAITAVNPNLKRIIDFIDEFSERKAIYSARPGIYSSSDGKFDIDYLPTIRDERGRELSTPFRVCTDPGYPKKIQASQARIKNYTVPGCKMWLYHEVWHVYDTPNPRDEFAADKGAIKMYLGMGNPIVEAYKHINEVFKNTPSDLNRRRYVELDNYIKNFYKTHYKK